MQLKDSYILAKNQKIEATEKVLPLIVTIIPPNSLLYLTNHTALKPSIKNNPIFKSLAKGISRHVFQALIQSFFKRKG